MEKENLNNVLGVEANSETTSKFVKTGRKFVSVQKHLSAFSVFMRVLIIIWGGMMLSFFTTTLFSLSNGHRWTYVWVDCCNLMVFSGRYLFNKRNYLGRV